MAPLCSRPNGFYRPRAASQIFRQHKRRPHGQLLHDYEQLTTVRFVHRQGGFRRTLPSEQKPGGLHAPSRLHIRSQQQPLSASLKRGQPRSHRLLQVIDPILGTLLAKSPKSLSRIYILQLGGKTILGFKLPQCIRLTAVYRQCHPRQHRNQNGSGLQKIHAQHLPSVNIPQRDAQQ